MDTLRDAHGEPIDPLWAAEFAGFMLADGSLEIQIYNRVGKDRHGIKKYKYKFLRPRVAISQRADNLPLLEAVCAKLGGHICKRGNISPLIHKNGQTYAQNPAYYWYVMSKAGVQRCIDILRTVQLPHRNLGTKLSLLQEFLDLSPAPGKKVSGATTERRWELQKELSASHKYSG